MSVQRRNPSPFRTSSRAASSNAPLRIMRGARPCERPRERPQPWSGGDQIFEVACFPDAQLGCLLTTGVVRRLLGRRDPTRRALANDALRRAGRSSPARQSRWLEHRRSLFPCRRWRRWESASRRTCPKLRLASQHKRPLTCARAAMIQPHSQCRRTCPYLLLPLHTAIYRSPSRPFTSLSYCDIPNKEGTRLQRNGVAPGLNELQRLVT